MDSDIRYNPQHWKVKATTNYLFLLLAIAILVNSILIFGFQFWFVYTVDAPEAILAEYPGSWVLDEAHCDRMHSFLLENSNHDVRLITLEAHPFMEKYRTVKSGSLKVEDTAFTKNVIGDSSMVSITILEHSHFDGYHESLLAVRGIPMVFILYSALLITVEIAGYLLIQKIRGT